MTRVQQELTISEFIYEKLFFTKNLEKTIKIGEESKWFPALRAGSNNTYYAKSTLTCSNFWNIFWSKWSRFLRKSFKYSEKNFFYGHHLKI
jgi:hypothetical protein